ncbi:sodium-dependent bicarbonate transport family permease [Paenibacillus turpanensis]|uniref:sodium-dependent bicarbonate transport family permease n=1 Tax=Paenibacillus turpanensis TaxID=2689078 RepID=UPI00140CA0FA|nr:sodium-dependent bicarbonate transport family permease [Paenibacillus turpanensis]
MLEIMLQNLITPVVLFFALGVIASFVKSDLKFPAGLSEALSIYLLIAIGLKGGIELSEYPLQAMAKPIAAALLLGTLIPVLVLTLFRWIGLDLKNAVGLAASYGSVSIVTYGAAVSFLGHTQTEYEGYMSAMVALMESPAILVSLFLLKAIEQKKSLPQSYSRSFGIVGTRSLSGWVDPEVLKESLFGKSILLLMGSLLVGWMVGHDALPTIKPLFIDLYGSILILFLLNMGLIAGERLGAIREHGVKLILAGILLPVLLGTLGVLAGYAAGLSLGGMTLMGVLAGSASYIAAPAALRASVPDANPSIYLGLSLGVTFPFNLTLGLPFFYLVAQWLV